MIDLSELRFLDLIGLRALLRAGQADGMPSTRLVGATGIVRRLIELTRALDAESAGAGSRPFAGELSPSYQLTTAVAGVRRADEIAANGNGNGSANGNLSNGTGNGRAITSRDGDAA